MEAVRAILTRRSKRIFDKTEVSREIIDTIIRCGLRAPSSKNAQPWRFHVVLDTKVNARVCSSVVSRLKGGAIPVPVNAKTGEANKKYESSVLQSVNTLKAAPVAVYVENISPFIGGRQNLIGGKALDKLINGYEFEYIGIGSAIENMLIAANSVGLGAVFMGDPIIGEEKIKKLLRFKGDFVGVIVLGYSSQNKLWGKGLKKNRVVWH